MCAKKFAPAPLPAPVAAVLAPSTDLLQTRKPDAVIEGLTDAEKKELARLETIVEQGLKTATKTKLAIGHALHEIEEKKLYRPAAGVVEYAVKRFQISDSEVSNIMGFAEAQAILTEAKVEERFFPANDGQYRELLPLLHRKEKDRKPDATKIVEVVQAVAKTAEKAKKPVTAEMIRKAVRPNLPAPAPKQPKPPAENAVPLLPPVPGFQFTASVYFHGTDEQANALEGVLHQPERNGGDGVFDLISGTNDKHELLTAVDAWLGDHPNIDRVEIAIHRTAPAAAEAAA